MRKFTFSFKSLLVACGLLLGSANAWGQVTTWTHAAGTYSNAQELSSNTSVISVKLGNGNNSWTRHGTYGVWIQNAADRTPTFTEGLPTAGSYIVIKPTRTLNFSLVSYSAYNNCNLVMIESTNPSTKIKDFRQRRDQTNDFGRLEANKTYYIYGTSFSGSGTTDYVAYKGFTATTYENYTIHFKDGEGNTIKSDVVHDGLLGASVSASGSDLDAIVYNEKTYAYSSGNTPITLTTGANEITLVYAIAGEHDYTVNAVAGGTTLKELATGSAVESMEYSVSNLPLVIEKDGNYYALTDAGVSGYTKTFTMGTSDAEETVEYTLDESIAYFEEGEVLYSGQLTASADCSNGAYAYYLHGFSSTFSLSAGWYRMETVVKDREGKNPLKIYLEDGTELGTIAKGGSKGFRQTDMFKLESTSNVKVGLTDNNNTLSFDYVLVRRLSVPLTVSATIGATGYTTFASPYALNLEGMTASEGKVTAFVASAQDGSNVTLTEAPEDVKAGEGLVLKGIAGATITIPVIASSDNTPENLLVGCPTATEITTGMIESTTKYYVVANNGGTAQFQYLNSAITIPAGKAYLPVAGTGVKQFNIIFDGETVTGVEAPVAAEAEEDGVYYNTSGQQVTKDYKGIVIVNGKKFLNK